MKVLHNVNNFKGNSKLLYITILLIIYNSLPIAVLTFSMVKFSNNCTLNLILEGGKVIFLFCCIYFF